MGRPRQSLWATGVNDEGSGDGKWADAGRKRVAQIPSVGEIVTIQHWDLVVTSLRLNSSPVVNGEMPVLNLLPVAGSGYRG
jgi:hypothetical protein